VDVSETTPSTRAAGTRTPCALLEVAAATTIGWRRTNADAFLLDEAAGLFAVADGMGDSARSAVVARAALGAVRELFGDPWTQLLPARRGTLEAAERMRLGIMQANGRLYLAGRERPLGATFAGVVVCGDRLCVSSVGDSRVYVLRASTGALVRLTQDDTLLDEVVRSGARREIAAAHPQAQALTRAIGMQPAVAGWSVATRWEVGDMALICTDGLTDRVDDGSLMLELWAAGDMSTATLRLLDRLEEVGATDNATVVLVRRTG
jgi:protein phosphatase